MLYSLSATISSKKNYNMKTVFTLLAAILLSSILMSKSLAQTNTFPSTGAAGIGTLTPNASSLLDITSTTKGILIPRMTLTQRNAIVTPAIGLMIYQTNSTPGFYYYSGSAWIAVSAKGASRTLNNLTAPTAVNVDLLPATTNTLNLGSSTLNWKNIYAAGSYYIGSSRVLDVTGVNTFIGVTGNTQNTGFANTAVGYNALFSNTSGSFNTANGYGALAFNRDGSYNTANGSDALYSNITGKLNTADGDSALYSNTIGQNNTATGENALHSNTTGVSNTADGQGTLYYNTIGQNNTANGYRALYFDTSGGYNTANGQVALYSNTNGDNNTASGAGALYNNTTGRLNAAVGEQALYGNTTGYNNTAIGEHALFANTTGSYNCALGEGAFFTNIALSNTSCIGYNSGKNVNASNRIELGNASVSVIAGEVSFSTYSDVRIKDNIKEDVPGLAFISKLRPVTYNLNIHKENEMVYKGVREDEGEWASKYDIEKIKMTGFVAQDVEKAAKETGYDFSGVQKPANPDELYSLRYSDFVMPLVKAVQELSKMNDDKDAKINELETRLSKLEAVMNAQLAASNIQVLTSNISFASLEQNIPNPFNHTTTINYTLPQQYSSAKIIIVDKTGKALKEINISGNGKGSLNVDASILASGAYNYSLLVDGKLIATKQMEHLK